MKAILIVLLCWCEAIAPGAARRIEQDILNKTVSISDASGALVLRLNYDRKCLLDQLRAGGRECLGPSGGGYSAINLGEQWFGTRSNILTPEVTVAGDTVRITGIRFGPVEFTVLESWLFTAHSNRITWRIDRAYPAAGLLTDTAMPMWEFPDPATWTGALLGHGGVAWGKLFKTADASYGVHGGKSTFWNKEARACLQIEPATFNHTPIATRFTRQTNNVFSSCYSVTEQPRTTRHGLSRYCRDRQDIWAPFPVRAGRCRVEWALSAPDYDTTYDLGRLPGVDAGAVREICHTIARVGAVDECLLGSNSYYSDCAVLHEPWLAQLGLAIDDPGYFQAFSDTLEFQRKHAIGSDGRVKPRWAGHPGDEIKGTYDRFGYYECQWGWLMDSQTSWVINVAEQFDFTGDQAWLRRQKNAAERVLEYLLARDSDGNGLVEMKTRSHREARGSDWLDVVWAAHENALINAQLYWALIRWAEAEELLGDAPHAGRYRDAATKLKRQFNRPTGAGGFWDAQTQCYVHWRDQDGSAHGTNFVVPVNFAALAYGVCDEPERRAAIRARLEEQMCREQLFFWPLCLYPYSREEGHPEVNWPFPSYENGDLFLAWGELGTRAYAASDPALALKYVRNVLGRYEQDGLAFQRYRRRTQEGTGDDILANNASVIVGLYRNLYGLQPKYNRIYLEPHLTPELSGTELNYLLRQTHYRIELKTNDYAISANGWEVRESRPFGFNGDPESLKYFAGSDPAPSLTISKSGKRGNTPFKLQILSWSETGAGRRVWREAGGLPGETVVHRVAHLAPRQSYGLLRNGALQQLLRADAEGRLRFTSSSPAELVDYALAPR